MPAAHSVPACTALAGHGRRLGRRCSFMFGKSISDMYQAVVFLFVVHPFDVGDALMLGHATTGNNQLVWVRRLPLAVSHGSPRLPCLLSAHHGGRRPAGPCSPCHNTPRPLHPTILVALEPLPWQPGLMSWCEQHRVLISPLLPAAHPGSKQGLAAGGGDRAGQLRGQALGRRAHLVAQHAAGHLPPGQPVALQQQVGVRRGVPSCLQCSTQKTRKRTSYTAAGHLRPCPTCRAPTTSGSLLRSPTATICWARC